MSQELVLSLTILLCAFAVSGAYLLLVGYLMPRNLERAFKRHFPAAAPKPLSTQTAQTAQVAQAAQPDPPLAQPEPIAEQPEPPLAQVAQPEPLPHEPDADAGASAPKTLREETATEFVDLYFSGCERGPHQDRQPLDEEWRANFNLVLAASPDEIWRKLFEGLQWRRYHADSSPLSLSSYVLHDKLNFYCHPRRLQEAVDWLNELVAETNQLYRRRLALAEIWPTEEAEFEEQVETALAELRLAAEPLFPSSLDEGE